MNRAARIALLLFLIASTIGFVVAKTSEIDPKGDALQYITIAAHLAADGSFADDNGPTMVREPLYPAFLSVIGRASGNNLFDIELIQALLLGGAAAGTFLLARRGLPDAWAAAAGVLVIPLLAAYVGLFLSELLAACLVLLAAAALIAADRKPVAWRFLSAGALIGVAALAKAVALYFAPVAAAAFLWRLRKDRRTALTAAVLLAGGALAVVMPWLIRNNVTFGRLQLASRGGLVLSVRASRTQFSSHDRHLLVAQALLGDRLTAKFWPDIIGKDEQLDGAAMMWLRYDYFRANDNDDDSIDALFGKAAVGVIARHPFAYAADAAQEFFLLNMIALPVVDMRALFTAGHPGIPEAIKDGIVIALRLANFAWIALVGYGIWLSRKNPSLFWPACVIVYWNLIHMAIDAIPRYAVPVLPLYIIFAAIAGREIIRRLSIIH